MLELQKLLFFYCKTWKTNCRIWFLTSRTWEPKLHVLEKTCFLIAEIEILIAGNCFRVAENAIELPKKKKVFEMQKLCSILLKTGTLHLLVHASRSSRICVLSFICVQSFFYREVKMSISIRFIRTIVSVSQIPLIKQSTFVLF